MEYTYKFLIYRIYILHKEVSPLVICRRKFSILDYSSLFVPSIIIGAPSHIEEDRSDIEDQRFSSIKKRLKNIFEWAFSSTLTSLQA